MKIIHIMPNVSRGFGGPTESLIGYGRAASARGLSVHVAAPTVSDGDGGWLRETLPDAYFHLFHSAGRHAWVISPGLWWWLLRKATWFDVVHVHGLFNLVSSVAARIALALGVPTVIRPFGTLSRYTFSRHAVLKRVYFALVDRPMLRRASALHFTTEAERHEAGRLELSVHTKGAVVPPPWQGRAPEPDMQAKADRPTVLFLSRLHPTKNVARLIDAWSEVLGQLPAARLWVAGDGESDHVAELQEEVASRDLEDSVSFLGFVSGDEKMRVLRESWVFVLPSHHENFGIAVLEALASGLPVVVSGEVQLAPFVKQHELGIVVDRTDSIELAEGIVSLLVNSTFRSRVAESGPGRVEKEFSASRIGLKLEKMYRRAVSGEG